MAIHGLADLGVAGMGGVHQQVGSLDNHAILAVAALRRLLIDPRLLERMERAAASLVVMLLAVERRQALERGDWQTSHAANRCDTGPDLGVAEENGASAALRKSTTEMWTLQQQLIAKHIEKWCIWTGVHGMLRSIDSDDQSHL